ncbi:MAG: response regulator [Blautia sp.]|nr:response regulator [Blautia sp.]
MSLYSVLLVDDEEDVIRTMLKKVDWEGIGFRVMGYAHNGIEALDLAEAEAPDVVLTDIKMPYMDGLELARNLKIMYPTVRILIFSGFDEFEYAKEAIRLEVEEYILKPVDADELRRIFARIKESLDREMDEKRNVQKLRDYYMESLPLLRENFYSTLVEGNVAEDSIPGYLRDYQIEMDSPMYTVVVVHTSTTQLPEGISAVLLTESVRRLARERLAEKWDAKMFPHEGNIVMLAPCRTQEDVVRITDEAESFCRLARHVSQAVVTIGIGKACTEISQIPESYQGAREAVSYRSIYGSGRAINIAEIEPGEGRAADNTQKKLHALFKAVKMNTQEAVRKEADACVDELTSGGVSLSIHRFMIMELVSSLYRFAVSNRIEPEPIFGEDESLFRNVTNMDSRQLREWLYKVSLAMWEQLRISRESGVQTFVGKAIDYVRDNYGDQDLTIDKICGILGVSAAYFSTTFKKETGKTFIAFLTDYRMEQAVQRLVEGDDKTYVIAAQVGYADPAYFSYVFKKSFGVSPSKYRSERR